MDLELFGHLKMFEHNQKSWYKSPCFAGSESSFIATIEVKTSGRNQSYNIYKPQLAWKK